MKQQITETILAHEERLRQAMAASDIAELDHLIADELVFTSHTGIVISKQDDLEMHSSGKLKIDSISLSEQNMLPHENIAIVTAKAKISGSYDGFPANGIFRFTRVWKRRSENEWEVIAGHACAVA